MRIALCKRNGCNGSGVKTVTNVLVITNCFEVKDILKDMGFRYNGMYKSWEKAVADDYSDLGNMLVDVVVGCKAGYDKVEDFFGSISSDITDSIVIDGEHQEKYDNYFDALES